MRGVEQPPNAVKGVFMNKAITDGLVLTPPAFENGLDVWSSQDGTPGSNTYASAANAAFVPADQDFGGCLELQKTTTVTKLRYMGETPILPGCYLRITARVKCVSGSLPSVRIAGWAGAAGGTHAAGVPETAVSTTMTDYGEVYEISAIVGTGDRNGVDLVWGTAPIYGHFGIDLTGANGGIVRVDDIQIEDITGAFLRDMIDVVDVRDYGAKGDGTTDDSAAFEAADAASDGRRVLVPAGVYYIGNHVTIESQIKFEGTVTMPKNIRFQLRQDFDLATYGDAFGDDLLGFKKGLQALLNSAGHESFDLNGRRIAVDGPIDLHDVVDNKTSYHIRRDVRNGQLEAADTTAWDTDVVTSQASYSASNPTRLTNVVNVANIPQGALVEGTGVGREIYVRAVDVGAQTVTLSNPLYDAQGVQTYTFKRFKYLFDMSGFSALSRFGFESVEFQCSGRCSGIMLPREGSIFRLNECTINRPKDRGITSTGGGDQGMLIDNCQFLSNEQGSLVEDRTTVALNSNSNDNKLRNNRVVLFGHFAVMNGFNHLISGNHFFQGGSSTDGIRRAGIVLTNPHARTTIIGNYVDNCFIEWTNEHDATPDYTSGFGFSALTITGNIFLASNTANWFKWLVVKPYGTGHFLHGLSVTGNTFGSVGGSVQRAEGVDTTFADLDKNRFRNITFSGNTFNGISEAAYNPVTIRHGEGSDASVWVIDCAPYLPFGGRVKSIQGVVPDGKVESGASGTEWSFPYARLQQGVNKDQIKLTWKNACRGEVHVTVRCDTPV